MKVILAIIMSFFFINIAQAQDMDRYFDSNKRVSAHKQQIKVVKKHYKYVREHRTRRVKVAAHRYEGETYSPDPVQWVAKRVARGVGEVLGGRPSDGPRNAHGRLLPWCGWWLGKHLGILDRKLWLARNWASVGAPSSRVVGAVVVWRHHVGLITEISANRIKVLSGNDGHRVRNRWRSGGGVIAYRRV